MNQISIVVAISENNAIGKDNQLLWHLPSDLKHFKNITTGHTIIMGRKTYDSIGKPLPNRRNIIITRQKDLNLEGVEVVNSLEEALSLSKDEEEVFIIGGAEIYKQAVAVSHRIYLTRVHQEFEADAFFPELDHETWREIEKVDHLPDEKNKFAYTFSTLERV
ncbi:dihydrofolate reductase [Pedobacter chitinilyticus]|uniref:Dihydrofolate reductase n=1 Tax=Pedobacter chitinilyticus TaxID=2233776 RepID=A0A443YM93_9SPHI|nr:dihydrofolate reductase [Pedobacter chitinilyticus]RWU04870.1 dihydrofolate reductase [Pedobacter chitinilyticus]